MDNKGSKSADELDVHGFGSKSNSSLPAAKEKPVSRPTVEEYYDTTNVRRGHALVFCHMNFSEMAKRNGADKDRNDICTALYNMDFEVHVYNDQSKIKVLDTLQKWSRADHSNSDCLVVVVMSYSEHGSLYARDAKYSVDFLWKSFAGNACPTLIGKPKLCFIQACRVKKMIVVDGSNDMVDSGQAPYVIPAMADLLVMYSSYDNHYPCNPEQCSWFIQSLCMELNENGRTHDLLTLLTGVTRRTVYGYQSSIPDVPKRELDQIPCVVSMLTKSFYFTKKTRSKVVTVIE